MAKRHFCRDRNGSTAVLTAVLFLGCLATAGGGLNYAYVAAERSRMQEVADAAAVFAARELTLARPNTVAIAASARSFVSARLAGASVATDTTFSADLVSAKVILAAEVSLPIPLPGMDRSWVVETKAVAKVLPGPPVCLLATEPTKDGAISLDTGARLTAEGCGVFSNSKSSQGIKSKDDAILKAEVICTAGGKFSTKKGNFDPSPLTDCPQVPDPLDSRAAPQAVGCDYSARVVNGVVATLSPGTYCGGLTITNGASVKFSPGVYVIKDGKLVVDKGASIVGKHVGFYFTGKDAVLEFQPDTTVDLAAPVDGTMAGLLVFEDRAQPGAPKHKILSNNAHTLLGTIYLPAGELVIDCEKPVADKSAYTIVVARKLSLSAGPNLVMNSDYASTSVPVPEGLGYKGRKVSITE